MTFFSSYPVGVAKIGDEYKQITDIFRRVYANVFSLHYTELETVTIPDGYTVEQVSDLYYNSPTYHWVILIVNNIIDVREEWPRSNSDLLEYCKLKYGGFEELYHIHHYETADGVLVQSDYEDTKIEVTNLEYEEKLNDAKREVKMLRSVYLNQFVTQYQNLITR